MGKMVRRVFNPVYHVFCFRVGGQWHRTTQVLDEDAFDRLMNKLLWMMPHNMRAFHFSSDKQPPASINPVFLSYPVIDVDLGELFEPRIGVRLKRTGQEPVNVLRFGSGLVIIESNDGYGRMLTYSQSEDVLLFEELYPLSLAIAREFVDRNHRHNEAPSCHKFSIGLLAQGLLVGVIIASTPKAKALNDHFTLELNRCCVLPDQRNACSKLYAKAIQAGRSMGYRKFVTYTLPHESGSSLKAVGFTLDGLTQARPNGWSHPSRPRKMPKRYPVGQKCRWVLSI